MASYKDLIESIMTNVGSKDNVTSCYHCATRLRFEIKDWTLVSKEKLEKVRGVLGTSVAGNQLQVIIGPGVAEVYEELISLTGMASQVAIDENLDGDKPKGSIMNRIVSAIADSFIPVIPVIVAASFISMFATILGPTMLNVLSAESDIYTLFTFVGNAGFYFLPVFMGMNAAKRFGANQVMGAFMGCILLHPTLIEIVNSGTPFTVFGIPMAAASYASSTIPAFLSVYVMSLVEKYVKKVVPNSLRMMMVPLVTTLVMLPVMLCVVGPLGTWIGNGLANIVVTLSSFGKIPHILVGTVIGGVFIFAIMFGMHIPLFMIAIGIMSGSPTGGDPLILPGMMMSVFALAGMELGAILKAKDGENRALAISYFITHTIGGITEPAIFGIGIRYGKPIIMSCIGSAIGTLFMMITGVEVVTIVASSNVIACFAAFLGGSSMNGILGAVGMGIGFVSAAVLTYLFGFKDVEY